MSRLTHFAPFGFTVASTLLLIACAQTPVVELEAYTQTYAKAHTAGDLLLDEVAAIPDVREAAGQAPVEACEIGESTGYRDCFILELALGPEIARRNELIDIKVRRLALAQIEAYTELLADLAQGKSAVALNSGIDSLQTLAGSVTGLPGTAAALGGLATVSQFVDLAQPLLAKIETMRASNAAAKSVLAAEPDIRDLIHLMRDDTPEIYRLYVNEYREKLMLAQLALDDATTAEEKALLTKLIADMTDPESPKNGARSFEKSLITYVKLLHSSEKALAALTRAIRHPMEDPVAAAALFATRATENRMLVDAFLEQIRTFRNPPS